MLGLYVHIPFCSAICNYCNFNRGLFDAALKTRYVEAVIAEISEAGQQRQDGQHRRDGQDGQERPDGRDGPLNRWKGGADPADTIYFGGGTPSLLEPDDVRRIIQACESSFAVTPGPEITLEANPETVTQPKLAAFREAG